MRVKTISQNSASDNGLAGYGLDAYTRLRVHFN